MFVQMRTIKTPEGNAKHVAERFSGEGIVEKQPGFVDRLVMAKKVRRGEEEVVVMIRWQSEDDWKRWEKSEAHIAGHKANLGKPKPDYIISSDGALYDVEAVIQAAEQASK
ncbi:hypothetical protein AC623_00930 [Bacillus sp. FJAT-27231]|uniref:antibiotic biosynthesis monooxygenase n=1 Tax=Bacillus sp. FJAT-27231 TaxID=1679168 RepID=UPI000670F736|nr:antibiotic biosynthesis monooxygenase [Bacillus sp. FJAT-27231]KMY52725.1 hypothetical protein AC623_00930 [Bacillus sp. FJAT-27231]